MNSEMLSILYTPDTHEALLEASAETLSVLNEKIAQGKVRTVGGNSVSESLDGLWCQGTEARPIRFETEFPSFFPMKRLHLKFKA